MRWSGLTLVLVPLALAAGRAEAHDAFEITTEARLGDGALALHVTMAASTAAAACAPAATLEACARGLYAITDGGQALAPVSARAAHAIEGDVEMTVVYPRPRHAPLAFEATFLRRLPDPEYGAVLTATAERVFLGQALLRADAPRMVVTDVPGGRGGGRTAGGVALAAAVALCLLVGRLVPARISGAGPRSG